MCLGCNFSDRKDFDSVDKWTSAVANLNNVNGVLDEMNKNLLPFQHLDKDIEKFRRLSIRYKRLLNTAYQNIHKSKKENK